MALAAATLATAGAGGGGCPIRPNTTVLVYNDTSGGAGQYSTQWETAFFTWFEEHHPDVGVRSQFMLASEFASCESLLDYPALQAWVQPGGNAYLMTQALGMTSKAKIVEFIEAGGLYVGTCAGWYYASPGYFWEMGSSYGDAGYWSYPDLLGLFPTAVEGSITNIQDMEIAEGNFHGNKSTSVSAYGGEAWGVSRYTALYYGGPTLGWRDTSASLPAGAEAVGVFDDAPGRPPAIVRLHYARSATSGANPRAVSIRGLLFSVHLEAHESIGFHGIDHQSRMANYALRGALLAQELAGVALDTAAQRAARASSPPPEHTPQPQQQPMPRAKQPSPPPPLPLPIPTFHADAGDWGAMATTQHMLATLLCGSMLANLLFLLFTFRTVREKQPAMQSTRAKVGADTQAIGLHPGLTGRSEDPSFVRSDQPL